MADKKLFLLDGHALVYRAHFAFIGRPLINSKGFNTSAVTGFTRTLWDLMKSQDPSHLAVVFDPDGPTFRNEIFPEYKANRDEQPEDIGASFPYIHRILKGMNIPVVIIDNYEADDVIGTLSKQAEAEGYTVYMVTPDKDYGQLVSENIFLYKPSRMGSGIEIQGVPEILKKWGIERPEQVIDMLGLQGDSVDNIPGVPGIGPKTAAKLLAKYDSIEGLLANTHELKGKQKERVEENREQALMSKRLATIDIEVPVKFNAKDYCIDPPNREELTEVFRELEFRSLAKAILGGDPQHVEGAQGNLFNQPSRTATISKKEEDKGPDAHSVATANLETTPHRYHLIDTPEGRKKLVDLLAQQQSFCFDTETTNIDPNLAELVGIAFAVEPGEAYYVPVPEELEAAKALVEEFKGVLEDPNIEKVGQNIKYDNIVLKWYDVNVAGKFFDTMIAHYLIEPEQRHNMDYLAVSYLKYKPVSIESLIGKKGKNQKTMRDVPVEEVVEYAGEDADITLQLRQKLEPILAEKGLTDLFYNMEIPLVDALVEMEYNGIRIDAEYLGNFSGELEKIATETEADIYRMAGTKFNIGSPKQVGHVLFEKLQIPYRWRRTKSGQYSTSEEKLAELAPKNPIIDKILRYRGLTKLRSTYVDALPKLINPRSGRIHSSFNQTLVATGRLSSSNPNIQNIPVRTEEGARVRKAFIPRDEDHILLAADYSQIELRLIAEISGEKNMLEAFQNEKDIHTSTAALIFDVPYDEVTRLHRYQAKTVNFAIVYGAGSNRLSQELDISREEAGKLIKDYFETYDGLQRYMTKMVEQAREDGYVTTLMGRRRYLRDINSRNGALRSHSERNAVNSPIQGTAADMIKIAMVNVHQEMQRRKMRSKLILQVHDELVFDAYRPELDDLKQLVERLMREAMPNLSVPIVVGLDTGENWLDAH